MHISSIWAEIKISKRNSVLVCAYYRQWSLPKECNVSNSNSPAAQKDRYILYSAQLDKASKDGCDIIVLTDENINSVDDNCNSSSYRNIELKTIRDNNIINHGLVYHNNLPNFIRKAQKSCIDFIILNCPAKINNVRTHYDDNNHHQYKDINYCNILSDHIMISCRYSNSKIKSIQEFRTIRNYRLLTKHALSQYFTHNERLNTIFNYTDPETISYILINELSIIINCIAPAKTV